MKGAREFEGRQKEGEKMTEGEGKVEVKVSFKCCKCGTSMAVVITPTDSH